MKCGLYAIFDKVAKAPLSQPIMGLNDGVAVRGFIASCKDDKIGPEEKELKRIATIDSESYEISIDDMYVVCNGTNAEDVYNDIVQKLKDGE